MWLKTKANGQFLLSAVKDVLLRDGTKRTASDEEVGIEFELEGQDLPSAYNKLVQGGCQSFDCKRDGSLDESGREFVFKQPFNRVKAVEEINKFFEVFKQEATINNSKNCSTHVHLNFQHMTILQVYSFLTLFYSLERPLFEVFAPERINNSYCRPLHAQADEVSRYSKNLKAGATVKGLQRYQAMNPTALTQHGSLECRMLGGSDNADKPIKWLDILFELYDFIKNNPKMTPAEICCEEDYPQFVEKNFPKVFESIKHLANLNTMLQFGIDTVQDIAFAVDWSEAKTAKPPAKPRKTDPELVRVDELDFQSIMELT